MKKIAIVLFVVLALGACKKKEKSDAESGLPPAAGEGAAPLPEIPELKPAGSGSGSGTGAGSGSAVEDPADSAVTGTLQAREEVSVAPKASGTIVSLNADEGSKVKKGDVLFRLDSRDAQLMKKSAMTQLKGAQLQLKTAQREYDRIQGLVAQNALPQQQLDQLEAQVDGAKVQIAAAQNSIAMANKAIGDATVRAPMSGVIIKKLLSVGEYATMMPPSPVFIIQDQSSLELKFSVSEKTLTTLHQGDPVTVSIPSLAQTRGAKVSQISPMVNPTTRTIELTAVLDNCDGALRPGLAAEVTLGAPTGEVSTPDCGAKPAAAAKKAPMPKKAPKKKVTP